VEKWAKAVDFWGVVLYCHEWLCEIAGNVIFGYADWKS